MTLAWTLAGAAATVALLVTMLAGVLLRFRLVRLAGESRRAVAAIGLAPSRHGDALAAIARDLDELHAAAAVLNGTLGEEQSRRRRLEENLRETEERYALAVRSGDDGMWEWNLKTGAVFYSPRWKSMLGHGEHEIGDGIAEWHSRIHPDDRELVLAAIQMHLEGRSPRFEHEHRVRHRDGRFRWVLVRAQAVRHASGVPYRMVGLTTDISARREVHQILLELADGLADLSGEACYRALVAKLADTLGAEEAFLAECCDQPPTRVRVLAHWTGHTFVPCEEFDLAGTPCESVVRGGQIIFMPRQVASRWPSERQYGTEGYLGLPCMDTSGTIIGHIACKSRKQLPWALPHHAILRLFAVRASVEMERQLLRRCRVGNTGIAERAA
jgi:PAS domain S-box-containing protein